MADEVIVKASATITLSCERDIQSVTRYYKLQSSTAAAPSKPTTNPPPSGWDDTEPSYTSGSTNTLYFCDLTVFSTGSPNFSYSEVSKSSSYEAAKEAYNRAVVADNNAQAAQADIDGLEIGGRNLIQSKFFDDAPFQNAIQKGVTYKDKECIKIWHNILYNNTNNGATSIFPNITFEENTQYTLRVEWADGESDTYKGYMYLRFEYSDGTRTYIRNDYKDWHINTLASTADKTVTAITVTYSSGGTQTYIANIKLEKGNRATDWTPAPEDVDVGISNAQSTADTAQEAADNAQSAADEAKTLAESADMKLASWCAENDETLIEGSKIYTGSITALQIAANTITAAKCDLDSLKASLITANNIKALNLEVGNQISMGANAQISWSNVSSKPSDLAYTGDIPTKLSELSNDSSFATTTQVSTAKSEAISSAASDAASKVKTVTDNIYTSGTTTINGSKITTGTITATQVNMDSLQSNIAYIGSKSGQHVLIDSDSLDIKNSNTVLASYGETIKLYNDGKEAFTIKQSEFLKTYIDPNGANNDFYSTITLSTLDVYVNKTIHAVSGSPITTGTTYVVHLYYTDETIDELSKNRYIIFDVGQLDTPLTSFTFQWDPTQPAYVYFQGTRLPCYHVDSSAVIDVEINGGLWINNSTDINGNVYDMPPLAIGSKNGARLEFDCNEIMARGQDAPAHLYLNMEGGVVSVNNNANYGTLFTGNAIKFKCRSWMEDEWRTAISSKYEGDEDPDDGVNEGTLVLHIGEGKYLDVWDSDTGDYYDKTVIHGGEIEFLLSALGETCRFMSNSSNEFMIADTDGSSVLIPRTAAGNVALGYGGYLDAHGATNIYGNDINLTARSSITAVGTVYVKSLRMNTNGYAISGVDTSGNAINIAYIGSDDYLNIGGGLYKPANIRITSTGNVLANGMKVDTLRRGTVAITPSAANTPTGKKVTWTSTGTSAYCVACAASTVPGTAVKGVACAGTSSTGTTIYLSRSNTTETTIDYIAMA